MRFVRRRWFKSLWASPEYTSRSACIDITDSLEDTYLSPISFNSLRVGHDLLGWLIVGCLIALVSRSDSWWWLLVLSSCAGFRFSGVACGSSLLYHLMRWTPDRFCRIRLSDYSFVWPVVGADSHNLCCWLERWAFDGHNKAMHRSSLFAHCYADLARFSFVV